MARVLVTDAGRGSAIAFTRSLGRRGVEVVAEHFAIVSAEMPLDDVVAEVAGLVREFDATRSVTADRPIPAAA